jgi:hypothetical protein
MGNRSFRFVSHAKAFAPDEKYLCHFKKEIMGITEAGE